MGWFYPFAEIQSMYSTAPVNWASRLFCVFGWYSYCFSKWSRLISTCIWFGLVLLHISHCSLFNAKCSVFTYIWFLITFCRYTQLNEMQLVYSIALTDRLYLYIIQVFSDYCLHFYCYIYNISDNMYPSLLQVFLVKLGSQQRTSNHVFYLIPGVTCSDSINHNQVQVLSIPELLLAWSQNCTCNLPMIFTL